MRKKKSDTLKKALPAFLGSAFGIAGPKGMEFLPKI